MNHLFRALPAALLGFALAAAPLRAQEPAPEDFPEADALYVGQVNALIDRAQERLSEHGYELEHRRVSAVDADSNWDSDAYLEEGARYAVVGVCDADCNDVDLQVYDPQENDAGSDYGMSDTGFVRFSAAETGSYKLELRMYGCQAPACYAALALFKKAEAPAGEKTGNEVEGGEAVEPAEPAEE